MTVANYDVPPRGSTDEEWHRRQIARAVAAIMAGRTNNVLDVTLTANAATTTVSDARVSAFSVPICVPATSNAQSIAVPYRSYSSAANGVLILNHANNANADKIFKIILVG